MGRVVFDLRRDEKVPMMVFVAEEKFLNKRIAALRTLLK